MIFRLLLLLSFVTLLGGCKPPAAPAPPDLQTPAPAKETVREVTAAPSATIPIASSTETPSATVSRPAPTFTRCPFPTMNPDVGATMSARANSTLWAMTYPTAVGTPDPFNLIEEAYSKGEIDIDHASVYRMHAMFGSPGLPERYQSSRLIQADGLGAYAFVIKDINRESLATKRFLGMFMTPREITVVPTAVHPSATPSPSFFPHGLYSTTVDREVHPGALPLAGRWKMDLTSPDDARFSLEGKLVITRLYRTIGNHIEFSDEFGSYACDDQESWSTYDWSLRDGALVLAKVQETCDLRSEVLEAHPWVKE